MPDLWQVEKIVDRTQCDRARLARDPRFDGSFFTCVKTTKIYCRPTCPSAHARQANIFFVPRGGVEMGQLAGVVERVVVLTALTGLTNARPVVAPGAGTLKHLRSRHFYASHAAPRRIPYRCMRGELHEVNVTHQMTACSRPGSQRLR